MRRSILEGAPGTEVAFIDPGVSAGDAESIPAARLVETGSAWFAEAGDDRSVAALLMNDRTSVELVLGALAANVRLASLPVPVRGADLAAYSTRIGDLLVATGATAVGVNITPTKFDIYTGPGNGPIGGDSGAGAYHLNPDGTAAMVGIVITSPGSTDPNNNHQVDPGEQGYGAGVQRADEALTAWGGTLIPYAAK